MNYILKYSRDERVKYISHLDFVRLFHRAVRRADIPFVFSQGFNPHPIMTVSQPLSVGVTSDCEYMKVGFDGEFLNDDLKIRMNKALPPGYEIKAVCRAEGKNPDLTKIDRAEYTVEVEYEGSPDTAALMENKELIVMKKTKSGEKPSDIRPYIYDLRVISQNDKTVTLGMTIAVGSVYNLKPGTVLDAMEKYLPNFKAGFSVVHRNSMTIGGKEIL